MGIRDRTKDMPYGIYTVHQVSGWEGSELMPDFDVFISQNGATYRYLINNAPFNSFIKIVKQDAETGKTIPYAGAGFKIYDPDGNPVTMTFTYPTPTTIDVFYTCLLYTSPLERSGSTSIRACESTVSY